MWIDDYEDKYGAYPEDRLLRWIWGHPRATSGLVLGLISGVPCFVGFIIGAWVF